MATPTTNQKSASMKYKFGDDELDLNDYIRNLNHNYLSYVNSLNWNEGLRLEFRSAYDNFLKGLQDLLANNTSRFSTDFSGSIIDSTGLLSNTDNDDIDPVGSEYYYNDKGDRITTDDLNTLRKRLLKKYSAFSANRLVATFFNKVGTALRDARKNNPATQNQSNAFNLSKHGFLANWKTANNPAGGEFNLSPYLEKDTLDETTGLRGTTNRAVYLKEQIENYLNNIGDYDFSGTPFKDREAYISKLRAAADNLGNGYNSEDVIALNLAGIGNEFLGLFFSTGSTDKPKTEAELATEDIVKMQQAELNAEVVKQRDLMQYELERNKYFSDYLSQNPFLDSILGTVLAPSYNWESMNVAAADKFKADKTNLASMLHAIKSYINFPQLASFIRGKNKMNVGGLDTTLAHIANNLDWAYKSNLLTDRVGESDYYIVPGSEDYLNWSYLAYNPNTRLYLELSMLLNEELKKRMAYAEYDRTKNKTKQETPKQENGGVLMFQGGGLAKWVEENKKKALEALLKEQNIQTKVKEAGKTREQIEAGERKPSEEDFSTIDKVRLSTAIADATAAVAAFVPGYGTAASGILGVGSTLTNVGTDIADDSMSGWDVAGNALYGLGMDVVGLIPGLGTTGKAAKIVRVLKPVSKLAMRTLLAYGMIHSANAFNKLMSNPSDMSADDWRNLVTGLQAISGEARYKGGKRAVNRVTTQRDVADVKTSTGRVATISKEDLDKLRKTKGLKALNKLFSELTSGLQLLREFKDREINWKKPWKSRLSSDSPEVSLRTESSFLPEDNSWDARLFRGMNRNTPQRRQQKKQLETQQSRFDKLRQLSSQTGKLTPQEIATINRQRVKSGKGKLTELEILALNQRRLNKAGDGTDNSFQARLLRYKDAKREGKFTSVEDDIKRAKDELAEATRLQRLAVPTGLEEIVSPDANLARFIMGFSRAIPTVNQSRPPISNPPAIIPKLLVRIEQPQLSPFNYDRIREGLAGAERERLGKDIGELRLLRAIEANPERSARLQSEEAYRNVRLAFNLYEAPLYKRPLTGAAYKAKLDMYNRLFNLRRYDVIEAFRNRELPHRQSNKKKKTSRDDRRTVKREDGGTLDLVKIRKFLNAGKFPEWYSKPARIDVEAPQPKADGEREISSIFSKLSPTITHGIPRAMYANRMNRKITDLAKESLTPLLKDPFKDPFEVPRYTRSDLDVEMLGERNYADLRRLASRPITSDGSLLTAALLQAEVRGLEARTLGKEKSNQVQRLYDELAWKLEKENAANRHETAMFNRAQLWGVELNKSKFELAYLSKKFNIWDVVGQLLEYDEKVKLKENKALEDNFAKSDIHNAISYTPNNYGANLTPDELTVWNKVLSGTDPSSLPSKEEFNSYKLARLKVSRAETNQLRLYYDISNTRWSGKTPSTSWSPTISKAISAKNGAKIAIAGIKAKTSDAERFLKQIKETIDRNEKALDRLSKSLYGIIKASMIK